MLQIDRLKSKKYLLDLARSLTCFKYEKCHIPEPYVATKEMTHESPRVSERILVEKVKQAVGWKNFSDVFMVSATLSHGSSDVKVSYLIFKV